MLRCPYYKKNSCCELYLFNVILTVIPNYDPYKLQCHQEIFDVVVESNSSLFNEFVCKLGSLWHEGARSMSAIKSPIYIRTS
jgi:hypothetical protein